MEQTPFFQSAGRCPITLWWHYRAHVCVCVCVCNWTCMCLYFQRGAAFNTRVRDVIPKWHFPCPTDTMDEEQCQFKGQGITKQPMIPRWIHHLPLHLLCVINVFMESWQKWIEKTWGSTLPLVYQHDSNLSNDGTLKIKHITNTLRSERHAMSYIFTRFGKQEAVVLGNLTFRATPGSLFWLSINPTSNALRLHHPWQTIKPPVLQKHINSASVQLR